MPKLNEVFGIATSVPTYTYVDRSGLDEKFKYLLGNDRHIVIHGSSKQGKTILRKKTIPDRDAVVVQCTTGTTCVGLYTEILDQLRVAIPKEFATSTKFSGTVSGSGEGKVGIPMVAEGKVSGNASGTAEKTSEHKTEPVGQNSESLRYVSPLRADFGITMIIPPIHGLRCPSNLRVVALIPTVGRQADSESTRNRSDDKGSVQQGEAVASAYFGFSFPSGS